MNQTEVEAFLTQRGMEYETKDQEHCVQVPAESGEVINFSKTGAVQAQGKNAPLAADLKAWKETGEPLVGGDDVVSFQPTPGLNKNVFVIYGHDTDSTDALDLVLCRMGLNPIILASLPAAFIADDRSFELPWGPSPLRR